MFFLSCYLMSRRVNVLRDSVANNDQLQMNAQVKRADTHKHTSGFAFADRLRNTSGLLTHSRP